MAGISENLSISSQVSQRRRLLVPCAPFGNILYLERESKSPLPTLGPISFPSSNPSWPRLMSHSATLARSIVAITLAMAAALAVIKSHARGEREGERKTPTRTTRRDGDRRRRQTREGGRKKLLYGVQGPSREAGVPWKRERDRAWKPSQPL